MNNNNIHSVLYTPRGVEKLYYLSRSFFSKNLFFLSSIVKRINQFIFHVNIYPEVLIGDRLQLPHGGFGVVIHKDTKIGCDAIIFHNVTIANGGARIGNGVYIGTGSVIIGAVNVGDNVVIGANSVINFDIPSNSTVVSPLAKILTTNKK